MGAHVIVAGIDLSLTSTGIAVLRFGDSVVEGAGPDFELRLVKTDADKVKGLQASCDRIITIVDEVLASIPIPASIVAIEGPSLGNLRQRGDHLRAGLWWALANDLLARFSDGADVVEVSPATLKKYATGKGAASKFAVGAAAIRRYPQADIQGDDIADAVVLAAIAARLAGEPIEASLPQTHLAAMEGITA